MMREIMIDVRELPSPEPMEKVIARLGEVNRQTYIKMVHRMEPMLLFPILDKNGFDYIKRPSAEGVSVYIFLKNVPEMRSYVGELT